MSELTDPLAWVARVRSKMVGTDMRIRIVDDFPVGKPVLTPACAGDTILLVHPW